MTASELRTLAVRAGIGPGTSVLDLCCGVAGPGILLAAELGCTYVGVDAHPGALAIARERAAGLPCRFEQAAVPPVPAGRFDVVLLLETLLAFEDKGGLLRSVAESLRCGGRFACTVEEGPPLTPAERAAMPRPDTVWPVPLPDLLAELDRAGLAASAVEEYTSAHRETAVSLLAAYEAGAAGIAARLGSEPVDDLLAAHRLWRDWLTDGRVRKFGVVAEKVRDAVPVRVNRAGAPAVFPG
ncbi:class I SAM-dependent methyltransferase [Nocardioides guangzhouensis]|uniref:Class I SAM-dependent methyltransferase n=2 Tax=Nocardioides guangzhouensis TaxID=2497878 RepID=A0A4Q4ZK67_9ACTN|nr:class I SAM-dependent methyltransferase [Nocardioides guangzhouensis]